MKISLKIFFLVIILFNNSCTKDQNKIKRDDKLTASNCPRIASLTSILKKEPLYNVITYAGAHGQFIDVVDGVLCKARFQGLYDLVVTPNGIVYVGDFFVANIRKITPAGIVSTFAGIDKGSGTERWEEDGVGTAARFSTVQNFVLNKQGDLFSIDGFGAGYGELGSLRKITPDANVSTLIYGGDRPIGYQDGPLSEAKIGALADITITQDGSFLIYDYDNNLIRKLSPDNMVSTYAGQKPVDGQPKRGYQDGPKENALFQEVKTMSMGPDGSLYFFDKDKVRRITPTGMVETIATINDYLRAIVITEKGEIFIANSQKIFKLVNGTAQEIAGNYRNTVNDGVGLQANFNNIGQMVQYKNFLYITDGQRLRRMNIE